jgi:serine/threonine protein kinase/tetratricopeptide (TPR) repeat protein
VRRAGFCTGGPDDPRLIAALEECLAGIEDGSPPDRALLRARYPDLAEDLFACLDAMEFVHQAAPHHADGFFSPELPLRSGRIGDYRLVRQLGRGGMGVVYEAEEASLGRRVALKVLPFASALEGSQLQRFQIEARVGTLLRHPHIVPVFATGCDRGIYYYAMQFIGGPSLAALIDAGRSRGSMTPNGRGPADRTPGVDGLPTRPPGTTVAGSSERVLADRSFREAARLGAEAAEALEAAHQAGVIHRDVKPSNLLLDETNGLWVADFGLARFGAERGLTRTGNLLGTLRYMSPEQALGRPGLVDHRTDVYSLGATLYELITLRPAFPGSDRQDLLRRIDREEPPRPRSVDPTVPVPLEAVVLKAMAKHPADRYGCALELAADLRRFIAGQRVSARPPSRLTLGRRWAMRHPGTVLLAAVAATVLLTVVSTAAILVKRKGDLAETRGQQARRAVDEMYTEVAERWMTRQPHLELVQQEFLEKARRFYEEFAREGGDDPAALRESARALRRVGDIERRLGHAEAAEAAYEKAAARLAALPESRPEDADLREEEALVANGRGNLLLSASRADRAEGEFRKALQGYERLSAAEGTRRYLLGRAGCGVNLGAALAAAGSREEAEEVLGTALKTWEELCRSFPRDGELLQGLAGCLTDQGALVADSRPAEAEALLRRSLAIEDRLLASDPGRPSYRHARATSSTSLAALLLATDRPTEARAVALKALTLREQLAADFPHTPGYRQGVASGRLVLGDIQAFAGRPADADSWYRAAAGDFARLSGSFPSAAEYRRARSEAGSRLGGLLVNDGRPRAAADYYRAALSESGRGFGGARAARQDAARARGGLGNALAAAGRPFEGEVALTEAAVQWELLAGEPRADDSDRWGFAIVLVQLAPHLSASGKGAEAEAAYRKALAILRRLAEDRPEFSSYRQSLAYAAADRSSFLLENGRASEAASDAEFAVSLAESLAAGHPGTPEYQRLLATCLLAKAALYRGPAETDNALRRSLSISRTLAGRAARTLADENNIAAALAGLSEASERAGRSEESVFLWRALLRQRRRLADEYPEVPALRSALAWLLANGPAGVVRDARPALAEARAGLALAPADPGAWLAPGAAAFRCGLWSEASDALERYCRFRGGVESPAGFLLAMTHWRQGERGTAAAEFERAEAWRRRNRPEEYGLQRLSGEAAALLFGTTGH